MGFWPVVLTAAQSSFASKLRDTVQGWIYRAFAAIALSSAVACTPSAAQKSDEKVCEELVISHAMSMASEINQDVTLKELITANYFDVRTTILVKDKNIKTAIIQKNGIQVLCRILLDVELLIDSRNSLLESDLYVGSVEFDFLFSRTQQQSTLLRADALDKIGAWAFSAWLQYVREQRQRNEAGK